MSNVWRDPHRLMPLLLAASVIVMLASLAAVMWPGTPPSTGLVPFASMQGAYDRVVPGRTSERELMRLGFDASRYRARTLSQLGVQEFFMPASSEGFDRMDSAVRACFDASDRCRALVFPLAPEPSGPMAAHAAASGHVVFLLRHGRVAYKAVQAS